MALELITVLYPDILHRDSFQFIADSALYVRTEHFN